MLAHTAASGGDLNVYLNGELADTVPIFALNVLLSTATDMWALRYPDTHDLFVLERAAGGPHGGRHLDHAGGALAATAGDWFWKAECAVLASLGCGNPTALADLRD